MDNKLLFEIIYDKYTEQKMSAEYMLQLTKVVELEDNFTKQLTKQQWKEYFDLETEKWKLQGISTEETIKFVINFLNKLK